MVGCQNDSFLLMFGQCPKFWGRIRWAPKEATHVETSLHVLLPVYRIEPNRDNSRIFTCAVSQLLEIVPTCKYHTYEYHIISTEYVVILYVCVYMYIHTGIGSCRI